MSPLQTLGIIDLFFRAGREAPITQGERNRLERRGLVAYSLDGWCVTELGERALTRWSATGGPA